MTEPNPIELIEQLRRAESVPVMAQIVVRLLYQCGIYNPQLIGNEISRLSVTSGLGKL